MRNHANNQDQSHFNINEANHPVTCKVQSTIDFSFSKVSKDITN